MPIFASLGAGSIRSYGLVRRPFGGGAPTTAITAQIFTESTSWTVPTDVTTVDYLVVAGGGAAGTSYGGGGGAGGYQSGSSLSVTAGATYKISIGAGGTGNAPSPLGQFGGDGSNSGLFDLVRDI